MKQKSYQFEALSWHQVLFSKRDPIDRREQTFEDWLKNNENFLFYLVKSFIRKGVVGMEKADLMQEARMKAFEAWASYDPNRVDIKRSTYIGYCVRRRMQDLWKVHSAVKRQAAVFYLEDCANASEEKISKDDEFLSLQDYLENLMPDSAVDFDNNIQAEYYAEIIKKLPKKDRREILYRAMGYTQTEIGQFVGYSQGYISLDLQRINRFIKEQAIKQEVLS